MDDRPSIIFASSLLSTPYIILAVVATAVIIAIGAVFVLRSGKGKNASGAGGAGNSDWQRQGQPGAPNMPGAWNQQQGASNNAWGQQAPTQQAGSWNAPNTNNWPGMQQQQQQQAENPWAAQQQQAATVNPWAAQQQQQPATNPWAAQQQQQPTANPWGAQQQPQPTANPWGAQQQQQPSANPWGAQQQQQPQSGAGWGEASSTPVPTGQQGGTPSWPGTPNMPAQPSFSGASNPGWGQPGADAWSNQAQAQPQANSYAQQGNPGGPAPSWQQQGGMGSNPNFNGNDATALYTDNDKTMLRSSGAVAGSVGMVRVEQGKEPGRIYEIRKESLSIGRSRESDIFLEDLAVSRLHASVVNLGNGNYALKDEGSANGTKVNGQLVNKFQTYPLQEGDQIQLGQTVLVFGRK